MQRDGLPRSGRFATAAAAGAVVAMVSVVFTGSPAWVFVFLILVIAMAIVWPTEEIRDNLAWRERSVPLPSWRYWLVSEVAYLTFLMAVAALLLGARGFGVVCAVISLGSQLARMVMRAGHIGRSLHLPRPPLSSLDRKVLAGSVVAYALMFVAIGLGQHLLALLVGAPAAIALHVWARDKRRKNRRVLQDALRQRAASSEGNDQEGSLSWHRLGGPEPAKRVE